MSRPMPPSTVEGVHGVTDDLLGRGYERDVYDSVAVYYAFQAGPGHYNQYAVAALDVNSVLGKAAYLAISMDYPDVFEHGRRHRGLFRPVAVRRRRNRTRLRLPVDRRRPHRGPVHLRRYGRER